MPLMIPLPPGPRDLARQNTHPGLALDKYPESWDSTETRDGKLSEKVQGPTLAKVVAIANATPIPPNDANPSPNPQGIYPDLFKRWEATICKGALAFTGTTAGPLTLHLARASALENAGICLHRIYGFTYLPGSGLKGLARAFAETVWLDKFETEAEKAKQWPLIEAVFGWAPGSDEMKNSDKKTITKPWKPQGVPKHGENDSARAGSVIFHDAWPEKWPRLVTDILNSHHAEYYKQRAATDRVPPPGDWEDPIPVYFLSVAPDQKFRFAVAPRRSDTPMSLVEQARDWLIGGLTQLGAGAKTASGYGDFTDIRDTQGRAIPLTPIVSAKRPSFTATLELVTPAFVGEADKHAVRLRSASVKALLRKWWRASRAHLSVQELARLEAEVFGDTKVGQGATVRTSPSTGLNIWQRGQDMGPGGSPLVYLGYGPIQYDRQSRRNLTQFDALNVEQTVAVVLRTRAAAHVRELMGAVWMFAALGGIGSRNRRGWGSLSLLNLDWAEHGMPELSAATSVEEYRAKLLAGLEIVCPAVTRVAAGAAGWTALTADTRFVFSGDSFTEWHHALADLGDKFMFFRSRDHRTLPRAARPSPGPDYFETKNLLTNTLPLPTSVPERTGFGLPYIQQYSSLGGDTATFTPQWMVGSQRTSGRRASPLLFKVIKLGPKRFHWQVAYLPARFLPPGATIRAERTRPKPIAPLPLGAGRPFPTPSEYGVPRLGLPPQNTLVADFLDWLTGVEYAIANPPPPPPPPPRPLANGQPVKAKIVADPKDKGRPFAEVQGLVGNILNPPAGRTFAVGEEVDLVINSVNVAAKQIAFRWPA